MLEVFYEMKAALLKTEDYLREVEMANRKPSNISQNYWTGLKRLAATLQPIKRDDFLLIGELCRILKIFHVETCRVKNKFFTCLYITTKDNLSYLKNNQQHLAICPLSKK